MKREKEVIVLDSVENIFKAMQVAGKGDLEKGAARVRASIASQSDQFLAKLEELEESK